MTEGQTLRSTLTRLLVKKIDKALVEPRLRTESNEIWLNGEVAVSLAVDTSEEMKAAVWAAIYPPCETAERAVMLKFKSIGKNRY